MKCEKCGNEYNSRYYFTTPTICNDCFSKLSEEEKQMHLSMLNNYQSYEPYPERVGFGRRFGAALIDVFLFTTIYMIALFITGDLEKIINLSSDFGVFFSDLEQLKELILQLLPLSLLLSFIYYSLEIFIAASPGKLMLGIMIGDAGKKYAPVSKLIIRFAVKNSNLLCDLAFYLTALSVFDQLSSLMFLIIFIGFFFTLSERKQAFHDMLADTAVYFRSDLSRGFGNEIQQNSNNL